ncbi:hypothetical protein FHW64_005555 [Variovorax sp. Sphag1AA]|nr:hypothetical protein [Variovorax sp. Sphag1AA]
MHRRLRACAFEQHGGSREVVEVIVRAGVTNSLPTSKSS